MQRRRFMKLGFAAAAVPTIVPRHVLGGPGHTAPSERITLGGVGIGGVGHGQIKGLAKTGFQVEALCDKYSLDVRIHGAAFRAAIKKDILSGYAVKDLHDIPLSKWEDCMQRIDAWTSYALVRRRREAEKGAQDHGRTD